MSTRLVERVASILERRTSRRGFLVNTTLAGSALTVAPLEFLLKPGTAYSTICRCGNPGCGCGSACCDGYTEFCCTLSGSNTCPPGTFAGGWWKADGSTYCAGPRYYIDCHSECSCPGSCAPGGNAFCGAGCDGATCDCAGGDCNNRVTNCVSFRYGQCHQDIDCVGRIACRVVTCTPAYLLDNSCTTTSMTDDFTAQQNAPCLQAPPRVVRAYGFANVPAVGQGVWFCGPDGGVFCYNGANFWGSAHGARLNQPVVGMAATTNGQGYWLVAADGGVFSFGSAGFHGSTGSIVLNAPMVGITATPDGQGYWTVAADGGVFCFGSATFWGSTGGIPLQQPIVGMAAHPSGHGYWLVASDGGVFTFGSAGFHGSAGGSALSAPVAGLVATPSGNGYWIWGQDGSIAAFGDAAFRGSYRTLGSPQPSLPSKGVDAFYGLAPRYGPPAPGSGTPSVTGYTQWAISPLAPPPAAYPYSF